MNLPPRYLNWRLIDGRKMPCRADGTVCDAHDPANHTDLATAQASEHGVAFDIRAEDGLFFLDLDKCYVDGQWTAEATAIFQSFSGAWGEVSQSGTGLHIIGRCDPSKLADRRNKWAGWLEFYINERFVAFGPTGWNPIGGTHRDVDWTDQLLRIVPQREHLGELPQGVDPTYTGPTDDDELIKRMLSAKGGAGAAFGMKVTVADLWNANAPVLAKHYPSYDGVEGAFDHSSADQALLNHLAFWTGKDMPRMDRLFRRSGLMREKYEKRADYRRDTVQNAARLCKQVYDFVAPKKQMPSVDIATNEMWLSIQEQIEHFEGCTYIRDLHRVLVPDGKLLKPEQFNATYGGHYFQMQDDSTGPTKKAFEAFTENRAHRFPRAVAPAFRPDLPFGTMLTDGTVNTYLPPNVDMRPGDITAFLDFMAKLLPNERDRKIVLSYMAAVVQYPGVKFQWAPVLQGVEGNGKTMLANAVAYAVGMQYTHSPNAKNIGEKFNAYVEGKIYIILEEVDMQGKREMMDTMKPLITNEYLEVRGMAQDKRMIRNLANWFLCTNHQDAVMKSRNDRRYAVFFTAQQSEEDLIRDGMNGSYFPRMYTWLKTGGGYANVAHFLTNYQIDPDLNPAGVCQRAPKTSSTDAAIDRSMGVVETEIREAADNNTPGFRDGWISSWALSKLMKDLHIRISLNKQAEIIEEMGYKAVCRASRPIMEEDSKRPKLYRLGTDQGTFQEYIDAQFYV